MMRGRGREPLAPDVYTRDLVGELPVLRKIAEIETRILLSLDSSDLQPHHWVEVARAIHEAFYGQADEDDADMRYDGAVIVHGTDTMVYTASALAFLLPLQDARHRAVGAIRNIDTVRNDPAGD